MRRKKEKPHENHERWLISYADFITLLFAFFVVMFASSQADKGRAEEVSESVKKALEGQNVKQTLAQLLGGSRDRVGQGNAMMRGPGGLHKSPEEKKDLRAAELLPSLRLLTEDLRKEIEAGQIQLNMQQRGLVISFNQSALFPSGEDVVSGEAYHALERISTALSKIPNPVRLEGHTDSVPISTARFRSNWELSAARSIAVMELLAAKFGVARMRMSIAGYADTAPIASNDSEEGRAKNRRVDIIILSEQGLIAEPK